MGSADGFVVRPCFDADVAKHQAADDAAADPIVEAAKERRAQAGHGAHRADMPGQAGPIGWPDAERDDEDSAPIGWPGGLLGAEQDGA
jgi:hypothetical protein